MDALIACYGDESSDSDSESSPSNPTLAYSEGPPSLPPRATKVREPLPEVCVQPLPPPPIALLHPPNFLGPQDLQISQTTKVRSFPHVDGNYALHVYIPINISSPSKKELAAFLKKISSREPSLHVVDVDVPLNILCKNDEKLEQVALGREFHISLGRTVPLRVHQIDSVVTMLKQKLQTQNQCYWIDFSKWEVFVNDDRTRTFLSLEVVHGGLVEIRKQIEAVNAIYKLHNLPEFYEDPRPHISLAWSLGDTSDSLKKVVNEEVKKCVAGKSLKKCIFTCKFEGIECKIGNKAYTICKISDKLLSKKKRKKIDDNVYSLE
ncbi:U6 snRNA phosphodiesterase isoform X1 [Trifolium pratense]|nr:U6 snRNA phosphodiesterase isoform X1 [Trifolium pratense]XP_045797436.1 U6 snRNA phosphodiesterase isoform X1 [Trifolium pratense]XP_045797437.1 U6 snRNA phosphodiesterase isoform X1 [Trifolium pratense]XP_045797438.1 U6 snRNA phosphodiesterase isoform X1 [Trifolium pratense]XP_045797439.1 U6 snRNA phosphodiesterase isoform X1 [Trifolium pratense]XP_045797440.1 U6 snRNA phosphodiesterase isoform X1 [Trifolium pratense]XP_045797441.1 U6 snRNA phosphodiesterase isoform X1 [Trifolium pratens